MMVLLPTGCGSFPAQSNLVLKNFLPSNCLALHNTTHDVTVRHLAGCRASPIFVVFTGLEGKRKISSSWSPFIDRTWVPTLHIRILSRKLTRREQLTFHRMPILNPSNAELNPVRHLLALVGARHIVHISRLRVKPVTRFWSFNLWFALP